MISHGNPPEADRQTGSAPHAGEPGWFIAGSPAAGPGTTPTPGRAGGAWTLEHAAGLQQAVAGAIVPDSLDLTAVTAMDTLGAVLLGRLLPATADPARTAAAATLPPHLQPLLRAVWHADAAPPPPPPREQPVLAMVARTGRATVNALREAQHLLGFFGLLIITLARLAASPRRLRLKALIFHMERAGLNAVPILGLLSFLIGVVLAYQAAGQLRPYGAEIFVVNLLGISVLREIGILMTAIIIAGRSGSAFTAQIGAMKVNQEVDALLTLGLDPLEILVVPRTLALILTLPLLAFYANVVGLLGGAVMCLLVLDISLVQFIKQLRGAVGLNTLMVGLIKAPVFALVIGMVGCYEGLRVTGSAESVGRLTTQAVVESIFLVIVLDAIFSILFAALRI